MFRQLAMASIASVKCASWRDSLSPAKTVCRCSIRTHTHFHSNVCITEITLDSRQTSKLKMRSSHLMYTHTRAGIIRWTVKHRARRVSGQQLTSSPAGPSSSSPFLDTRTALVDITCSQSLSPLPRGTWGAKRGTFSQGYSSAQCCCCSLPPLINCALIIRLAN